VVAYIVQATTALLFTVLYAADLLTPWRIMGLVVVSGFTAGFQWAPIQSLSAVLVPRSILIYAVRLVSISFTAGRAVGPALAAVVLAFYGPGLAYALTFFLLLIALAMVVSVRTEWQPDEGHEPFVTQFVAGVRYVWHSPPIRLAVALAFAVATFGAIFLFALVASVADDAYGAGGGGLGALAAMAGVGSIIGSIFIAGRGGNVLRSRLELVAIGLYVTGLVLAASTPLLLVGLAGYIIVGIGHMLHGVNVNTTIQVVVEEEYRGRVMSVWLMALLGGLPTGALVAGALADVVGIRAVMIASSLVLGGFVVLSSLTTRGLKPLDAQ
jgi:predicted MFS family arabinose efflux permease